MEREGLGSFPCVRGVDLGADLEGRRLLQVLLYRALLGRTDGRSVVLLRIAAAAMDAWEQDVLGEGNPLAKTWRVGFLAMGEVLLRGDSTAAVQRARALPEPHAPELRLALAELFAVVGRPDDARALPQGYDETTDTLTKIGLRTDRGSAEGRVLLSEGDSRGAVRRLQRVGDSSFGWSTQCSHCYLATMGEAYEALGMPDSAAVKYEAFLHPYWMFSGFRFWRIPWLGTVHERLGGIHEGWVAPRTPSRTTGSWWRTGPKPTPSSSPASRRQWRRWGGWGRDPAGKA